MKASHVLLQGPIAFEEIGFPLVDLTSPFMLPINFLRSLTTRSYLWSVGVEVFLEDVSIPPKAAMLFLTLSTNYNFKRTEEIFSACHGGVVMNE